MFNKITFNGNIPSIDEITKKIADICGLAVVVADSFEELPEEGMYESIIALAFECDSETRFSVVDFRKGRIQGNDEIDNAQVVYLRTSGKEITLYMVAQIAFELLGGKLENELTNEDRHLYNRLIDESEINRRHAKNKKEANRAMFWLILMLPVYLPVYVIWGLLAFLTAPISIWLDLRKLKRRKGGLNG